MQLRDRLLLRGSYRSPDRKTKRGSAPKAAGDRQIGLLAGDPAPRRTLADIFPERHRGDPPLIVHLRPGEFTGGQQTHHAADVDLQTLGHLTGGQMIERALTVRHLFLPGALAPGDQKPVGPLGRNPACAAILSIVQGKSATGDRSCATVEVALEAPWPHECQTAPMAIRTSNVRLKGM